MAKKRMFNYDVLDSDSFLNMPLSTQALYFHLNLKADDDGFIGNPVRTQIYVGASSDDLRMLIAKGFIIQFESGVMLVKHWRMHNAIRKDRYTPTVYQEEFRMVGIKENMAYTLDDNQMATKCTPLVSTVLGKVREELDKDRESESNNPSLTEVIEFCNEKELRIDANKFYAFYSAKNWQGVKDWKAKALYWDIQDREKSNNGFNGIMTHSYDYEELEKEFVCK